jgi:hypothetical protein
MGARNMKNGLDTLSSVETGLGAQNIKTGPDAHGTVENESGSAKHEN